MRIQDKDIETLIVTNMSNQILFAISDKNMFGSNTVKVFIENFPGELTLMKTTDGVVTVLESNAIMTTDSIFSTQEESKNISQSDFVTIDGGQSVVDPMLAEEKSEPETQDIEIELTAKDNENLTLPDNVIEAKSDISKEVIEKVPPDLLQKFLADFLERTKQQKEAEENKDIKEE